tara:strand:+ start:27170 stop:27442 length:273 start_codon:yes stop_codon:yes gene_type:complete
MGQYDDMVEKQRLLLEAEEWAKGIKSLHVHSLKSCWYDDRPKDTDNGNVMDTEFNDGKITREKDGKLIHTWNDNQVSGDELIDKYIRGVQ